MVCRLLSCARNPNPHQGAIVDVALETGRFALAGCGWQFRARERSRPAGSAKDGRDKRSGCRSLRCSFEGLLQTEGNRLR